MKINYLNLSRGNLLRHKNKFYFCTLENNKKKHNVLFFGNDIISMPTIAKLYEESYNPNSVIKNVAVVTTPVERTKSTQGIFHRFINEKKMDKIYLNVKEDESGLRESWRNVVNYIKENSYDIGVIASFGKMIPGSVITTLKNGAYVMHPSLLPKYRGASPIQHSILNNENNTGVSLIETSLGKFDAGDIILQKEIKMEPFYRFKELSLILSELGAEVVMDFLRDYDILKEKKTPQDETKTSKAKLIKDSNFAYLDFKTQPADKILSLYKAFFGSQLDPFTKIKIKNAEKFLFFDNLCIVTQNSENYKKTLSSIEGIAKPGAIYWDLKTDRNNIYIKSQTNWLVTNKIKMDGINWTEGEKVINKIFINKRFRDKNNFEFLTMEKDKTSLPQPEDGEKVLS